MALALLLPVLIVACSTAPHWTDADAHVVDGHWVRTEMPCDLAAPTSCTVNVDAAFVATGLRLRDITSAATAGWPLAYVDGRGQTILGTYAGLSQPGAVILDLADGTRRVVGVMCSGPITTDGGAIVSPVTCEPWPEGADSARVGNEPWLRGS